MPRKGRQQLYDDEDEDDYYYDDDDVYDDYTTEAQVPPAETSGASGLWQCPICTYENLEQHLMCDICGVVRQSTSPLNRAAATRDGYMRSEPSLLARSLFALPRTRVKKGMSFQQIREKLVSSITTTSQIEPFKFDVPSPDDKVAGAKHERVTTDGSLSRKGSSSKTKPSVALWNESENGDGKGMDDMLKNIRGQSKEESSKGKGKAFPIETYKPETWALALHKKSEKRLLHLVVVGHVDAGKSTLMGRMLHTLGRITQKEMHKNRKEANEMGKGSFAYAWVLDEGSEERARGVTISVAVAHFETNTLHFVLLDAPGHRDFVPNMISGASQADAAILVVDASTGGFEAGISGGESCGQTREHAQLVRSLGINQLIVAVNKMDSVEYAEDRFEEIQKLLTPFLRQCGFKESAVAWVPVSAVDGQNLVTAPTETVFSAWYKGSTLLDALDKLEPPEREIFKPFRLAIAEVVRSRSLGGSGIGGKIECGAIKLGSKVIVMPGREMAIVKSIEEDGKSVTMSGAGESVDVSLQGVDASLLVPGGVICHPDFVIPVATHVELRILTLDIHIPILRGAQVVMYVHHAKEAATVTELVCVLGSKSGNVIKQSPRCLTSNQSALIQVATDRGVCIEEYSKVRGLGRVVLRSGGKTLAVGIVTRILHCT